MISAQQLAYMEAIGFGYWGRHTYISIKLGREEYNTTTFFAISKSFCTVHNCIAQEQHWFQIIVSILMNIFTLNNCV